MAMLDRKLRRDLWRIKIQALAIALVIGAGVAVFVMAFGTLNSIEETRAAYYERARFADIFAFVKRAPEVLARRLARIPGVRRVESRIVHGVTLDVPGMAAPALGRLVSLPPRGRPLLNDVTLRQGRMPAVGRSLEAVVNEAFAEAHGFGPGEHVFAVMNGKRRRLTIVGIVLSPEYAYAIAPGDWIPDNKRYGVFWLPRETLAAAFDLDGAFNDITVSLEAGAIEAEVIETLDRLLEPYGGTGAYGRDEQQSNWYLNGEIKQLQGTSIVVPPIFLAVAAFLLNIVVSRLIQTEREAIGLLKAFGYTNTAVGSHYLKLVLAMTVLGVALGCLGGAWLGRGLTEIYTEYFRFPFLQYEPGLPVFAISVLVSIAAAVAGTIGAVLGAARLPPAVAMAPAPPPLYHRSAFEPAVLLRLLAQTSRMILRQTIRWPLRAALTTLGISLAVTILIGASYMIDAIEHLIEMQFHHAQRQDMTLALVEPRAGRAVHDVARLPGVLAVESFRAVPARLRFQHRDKRVAITGIAPSGDLNRLLDVSFRPVLPALEGLTLSTKLAEILGATTGDVVVVEVLEGRRPVRRLRVEALVEEYFGANAYMDLAALNRLMDEGPAISGAHLRTDPREQAALYADLKATPAVAGIGMLTEMLRNFREELAEHLLLMTFINTLFACSIAFGVVYNSTRIALSERARELATLRVLGFTRAEVAYVLLGQIALFTALAIPLGCVLGYGLAWLSSTAFDTELYRIPLIVLPATYGLAGLVVGVAALVSAVLVAWRVARLDLVRTLKTRE
ncbi:MAG: FtsX-like permease family protein [Alphaproteobacteria bacterium]|jgi:putative ABC transport system permease protein|nr:FtsX-like permease family protein [Alphaproteobacteria bacterium]